RSAAIAVLLLSLAASARASTPWPERWRAAGFADVAVTKLSLDKFYASVPPFETKGAIDAHFLLLRCSGWTRADVDAMLSQLTLVYSQCGLRFDRADLVEAAAPLGRARFYKYKRDDPASLNALARAVPLQERPLYYLLAGYEDSSDDDSFSRADWEEPDSPGEPRDPALFDSVFLPSGIRQPEYRGARALARPDAQRPALERDAASPGKHLDEQDQPDRAPRLRAHPRQPPR